ncbi:sirohydrochlorin chelatase [Rhizohabitans arisaemae]|uniref:sirohydrochlorin chelatase n=1 Tax=Rhizohabitans arisaemae TaxID=2720610 RepID=UPI0024B26C77|nr:sirohydrochlorin chelatase [Rhizohabitans arisaemae]
MSTPLSPLIAVAHGSRDPRAAATVEALMARVRLARPGLTVRAAYLDHASPTLAEAMASVRAREAVVLPLLLTEAYHSRIDLPAALEAAPPHLRIRYGGTLGPHPLLTHVMERRLARVGVTAGDPSTAVVLAAAGSSDPAANAVIAAMAQAWRARGWWSVTAAYASAASPTPEEAVAALRAAGAPRVVVAPYLLAPGYFADKVRRTAVAAGAAAVGEVLGAAPEIARVVLERYLAVRAPESALAS